MQLTVVFLALVSGALASSGFGLTCSNIHLTGSGSGLNIAATCLNAGGGNNGNQVLGLNSCLANNNGALSCQFNGNAMNSCRNCSLGGTVITCTCTRTNGGTDTTSFDLNNCIGNNDGQMVCP